MTDDTPRATAAGAVPLLVGITGHRDLRDEDMPRLEQAVRAYFTGIRTRYPATPVVVVSCLATGADQLAARVADETGCRIGVVLPMDREEYARDFTAPDETAEFDRLFEMASMVVEAGDAAIDVVDPSEPAWRARRYAAAGAWIARHCPYLLALWDGVKEDAKEGGTAAVVRYRLEGVPTDFVPGRGPLDPPEIGPVHWLATPRASHPATGSERFQIQTLLPLGQTEENLEAVARRIDGFNADRQKGILPPSAYEESRQQLLQTAAGNGTGDPDDFRPSARRLLDLYSAADALAVHFSRQTAATTRRLFLLVLLAALMFNIFHSMPHGDAGHGAPQVGHGAEAAAAHGPDLLSAIGHVPWFLIAFLGISGYASGVLMRRASEHDYQNKYQDYRALAEGLRVQFFWNLAGIPDSVADHYLGRQRSELEWIRQAIRSSVAAAQGERALWDKNQVVTPDLEPVRRLWVDEQRRYYARKAHSEHHGLEKDERKIELGIKISVGLAMIMGLVLTLPVLLPIGPLETVKHIVEIPWLHGVIMIGIVMSAVAAGLLHGYNQQIARPEHTKHFGRMSLLFDSGARILDQEIQAGRGDAARRIVFELGRESLSESADWLLLHRDRPLDVPHAA